MTDSEVIMIGTKSVEIQNEKTPTTCLAASAIALKQHSLKRLPEIKKDESS